MKTMLGKVVGGSMRAVLRLARDRRGGTAIEAIVMLPVVLAALGFGALLWETISVRRSMHTGTYLATRFLSLYPPRSTAPADWESVARMFVYKELKNSPWTDPNVLRGIAQEGTPMATVVVTLVDGGYQCGNQFTIDAEYPMRVLPGSGGERVLPFDMGLIMLKEHMTGEVICQ